MSLLSKSRERSGHKLYERQVKSELRPKDGNIHVVMITSFTQVLNNGFDIDHKYTQQVGSIIDDLQNDGYEIVDIKLTEISDQGVVEHDNGFHTLIMYK